MDPTEQTSAAATESTAAPPSETPSATSSQCGFANAAEIRPLEIGTYDKTDAETWFARAESIFRLRNIKADNRKSALLIQALPPDLFKVLWKDISAPSPPTYDTLKGHLLDLHGISTAARAKKIFSFLDTPAGDQSPSVILKTLQHWAAIPESRSRPQGNLNVLMEIMLQCFPPQARCMFPDYRTLSEEEFLQEADKIAYQARQQQELVASLVSTSPPEVNTEVPEFAAPIGIKHQRIPWCHYHDRFGPKARNCIKPCGFITRPYQMQPQRPPGPTPFRQVSKRPQGSVRKPNTCGYVKNNDLFNEHLLSEKTSLLKVVNEFCNSHKCDIPDGKSFNSKLNTLHTLSSSAFNSSDNDISECTSRCKCTQSGAAAALPSTTFSIKDEISGKSFLVDTGACRSFIPPDRRINDLQPYDGPSVVTASGDALQIHGKRRCRIKLSGKLYLWDFIIADVSMPILGADFLVAFDLAVNLAKKSLFVASCNSEKRTNIHHDLQIVLDKFPEVFCENLLEKKCLTKNHGIKHEIKTSCKPINSKFRRLDPTKLEIAKSVFNEMEAAGVCEKAASPWASPLHMVPKPDGSFRPCGDYRRLNMNTEPDHYPLPNMSDITNVIGNAKYFSKIDMLKGYFQIPVSEQDKPKTAIITPFGTYIFNYTCFGLRNAGATFQRLMDNLFGSLSYVIVYIDDILIFSDTLRDHIKHVKMVLSILSQNGLVIKPSKCDWGQTSVDFLGFNITSSGIKPIESKVNSIVNFPRPESIRQLQEFNGMVNFYHRFIPKLASIMAPLYESLKNKPKHLVWTSTLQNAFDKTKLALAGAVTLSFPVKSAKLILTTDASDKAIGAVLEQVIHGARKPIAFFSAKLSNAELNYSTLDKELLAIHRAFRKFHHFLAERPFICQTDHQPLINALTKSQDQWTGRRQRQLSEISSYQCTLVYIKGSTNSVADALSRNPPIDNQTELLSAISLGISYEEIAKAQDNDEELQELINNKSLKWVHFNINGNRLSCDTSTGRPRPFIPKSLRQQVFLVTHNLSHPSAKVTAMLISERYIWKNMKSEVKRMAQGCLNCQKSKINKNIESGIKPYPQTSNRLSHIHMDVVGPLPPSRGYTYLLTIIDRATRWPDAIPLTSTSAEACANALITWISRYGIPETVVTDNATNFTSNLFKEISNSLGIQLKHTSTYNPESNGIIERCHRTLKTALTARCVGRDWSRQLQWVLLGLRTTPHTALGASPAEVLYGKNLRIPADLLPAQESLESIDSTNQYISKFLPTKITYNPDKKAVHMPSNLLKSNYVFEKISHHKFPLSFAYEGPYQVIDFKEKVVTVRKNCKPHTISIDRIKAFTPFPISDNSPDQTISAGGPM